MDKLYPLIVLAGTLAIFLPGTIYYACEIIKYIATLKAGK